MKKNKKTREQLLKELEKSNKSIAELENYLMEEYGSILSREKDQFFISRFHMVNRRKNYQ